MTSKTTSRKRKLPRDLQKATELAQTCVLESRDLSSACSIIKEASIACIQQATNLTENDVTSWLVCHYGIKVLSRVCKVQLGLPTTITDHQRRYYLSYLSGIEDAPTITEIVQSKCPSLCEVFADTARTVVLAPPVLECFNCAHRSLTANHQCEVHAKVPNI